MVVSAQMPLSSYVTARQKHTMIFYSMAMTPLHAPRLATTARLLHRITQARPLILTLQLRVNLLHKHRPLRRLARLCTPRHALAATRCFASGHLFYMSPRKYGGRHEGVENLRTGRLPGDTRNDSAARLPAAMISFFISASASKLILLIPPQST